MTETVTVTVKTERVYKMPTLPSHIKDSEGKQVSIGNIPENQLQEIGKAWTEALLRKARKVRGKEMRRINKKLGGLDD